MKLFKYIGLCCLISWLMATGSFAEAQEQFAFRVSFADKNSTDFELQQASTFLSQKALDRRNKYNIPIDSTDLPVPSTYIDSVLFLTSGILHLTSKWQNHCVILVEDTSSIHFLDTLPFIETTRLIGHFPSGLHQRPSNENRDGDTNIEYQYRKTTGQYDSDYYGSAWNQIHLSKGDFLHQQGYEGQDMLIAVLDVGFSGVDKIPAFDSMFKKGRLIDTWNFIYDTAHVWGYGTHGTQVFSCIGAYAPGTFVGTAPLANYALYATDALHTEHAIEEDNWLAAAERADSIGADIISSSVGYNYFDLPKNNYSFSQLDGKTTVVARAANAAARKGILVVSSAGNEGNASWTKILTPGDADSILTVGNVTPTGNSAPSSSEGPNAGGAIKPNVCMQGQPASTINGAGNITNGFGTSLSAPILAGLAACALQAFPQLTPLEMRAAIEQVAHLYQQPTNKMGYGIPDFEKLYFFLHVKTQNKHFQQLEIFPNPVSHQMLNVNTQAFKKNNQEAAIFILDIQGRKVREERQHIKFPNIKIQINDLTKGIYFLHIQTKEQYSIGEFIKL